MANPIDGVTRIEVPTPFPVGNTNCYLIEGSPLTLIDTGPKTSKSLTAIQNGLQANSYDMPEIEQILLTHGHVDHVGLAAQFVKARLDVHNECPDVWINENDAIVLLNYENYMDTYMRAIAELIQVSGIPRSQTQMLAQDHRVGLFRSIGESVPTAHSFKDNATFKTGIGELTAIFVPGHSPGSTCFVCDEQRIIFSGDHILSDISSNPSISFGDSERIGMMTYFASLDRLSSRDNYTAYPGHREPILDIRTRIETLRAEYADKIKRAASSLTYCPQTVYEISRAVYGDYELSSLALALAESYDLIRILENRDEAMVFRQDGIIHVSKPR
jgi:glyoxylase-like metal-dependent hydrolase (beta-lactamase superfamily II)